MNDWFANLLAKYSRGASADDGRPDWLVALPHSIVFLDVQTTGPSATDRIVTFGAIRLTTTKLQSGLLDLAALHLIFNPARPSFTRAERVHGYSDWVLRHQDKFLVHAEAIEDLLESSELIVAHNAEADLRFVNRELAEAGRNPVSRPSYCTLNGYRRAYKRNSPALEAICEHLDLPPPPQRYGVLGDAWLAMLTYLWLHKCPHQLDFPSELMASRSNLKDPPRLPASLVPNAKRAVEPVRLTAYRLPTRAASVSTQAETAPALAETTPLPANDLRPCLDEAPPAKFVEDTVRLPEILITEDDRPAAVLTEDLPRLPADVMLPALVFNTEQEFSEGAKTLGAGSRQHDRLPAKNV